MKKFTIEIKWAVIFIVAASVWMLLEKISGLHSTHIDKHAYLSMLFMIPAVAIFVFALKDKKKNFYNGNMTYLQGVGAGLIITLIVALFSPASQYISSEIISPEYFRNAIDYSVSSGHQTQEEAENFFNLNNYMVQSVFGAVISGIITSLIVALFVKTKSP